MTQPYKIERTLAQETSNAASEGKNCPFLQNPFDECYCYDMRSQDIEYAIYYCGKHFDECETYRNIGEKDPPKVRDHIRNYLKGIDQIGSSES